MDHLQSVEQTLASVPAYLPLAENRPTGTPSFNDAALDELRFRQLRTPSEVSRVLHLRQELRLPETALNDAGFAAREKKETRSDLLELLNWLDESLEPFGLYPWAKGLRRANQSLRNARNFRLSCWKAGGRSVASYWPLSSAASPMF